MSLMIAALILFAGFMAAAADAETEPFLMGDADAEQAIGHTGDTLSYVTGPLEQDTTWRDTVYVGGDVTIAAAATLTLAPNTQVLFLPYRDATQGGLDSTRAELIVEGQLHAQAGGIVFRSADVGSLGADWYGLVVERGGIADVSNAAVRDGLRCVYAKRGGRVTMDSIAFANCGKPTASADAAKPAMSAGTVQKEELGLSHQRANLGERVVGKFCVGTLMGSAVLVGVGVPLRTLISDRVATIAWVGYPIGVGLGTSLFDRHDYSRSLVFSIGGSFLGAGIGLALIPIDPWRNPIGAVGLIMLIQPITATLASELFRKPPESGRFSVGLMPDARGNWSVVATLRF